jgi:hypothetical protein
MLVTIETSGQEDYTPLKVLLVLSRDIGCGKFGI